MKKNLGFKELLALAIGGLRLILEFGSITFLLVSLLMSIANFKIREDREFSVYNLAFHCGAFNGNGFNSLL